MFIATNEHPEKFMMSKISFFLDKNFQYQNFFDDVIYIQKVSMAKQEKSYESIKIEDFK